MSTLNLTHVSKTYRGRVHALRGIELRVEPGEVFGLLGPNGAGKSTLVKILMTVIRPSSCKGTMLGHPVGHKPALAQVGYLPEHHKFPPYLKGRHVLDYFGALAGVPRPARRRRAAELLDVVGIAGWADKKVGGYSKGMRQRLGIAQALMNDPKLVVLDEPTDGVDPVGRREIRDIVKRLKDEQRTVFINSHLLSELEMVSDRVAIMVQGLIRSQGTLDELTAGQRRYDIDLGPEPDLALAASIAAPHISGPTTDPARRTLTLPTDDAAAVQPVIDALRRAGLTIHAVRPHRPSLEDLFIQAVTDPATGKPLAPGAERPSRRAKEARP